MVNVTVPATGRDRLLVRQPSVRWTDGWPVGGRSQPVTAQVAAGTRFVLGAGPRRPTTGQRASREWIEAVAQAVLIARFVHGLPVTWVEPWHTGRDVRLAWLKLFSGSARMREAARLMQALAGREPESRLVAEIARACKFIDAIGEADGLDDLPDGFLRLTALGAETEPGTSWGRPDSVLWSPARASAPTGLASLLIRARPDSVVVDLPGVLDRSWRAGLRGLLTERSGDGEVVFRCRGELLLDNTVLDELAGSGNQIVVWIVVLGAHDTAQSFGRVVSNLERHGNSVHRLGGLHLPVHRGGTPNLQALLRISEDMLRGR